MFRQEVQSELLEVALFQQEVEPIQEAHVLMVLRMFMENKSSFNCKVMDLLCFGHQHVCLDCPHHKLYIT